MSATSDACWQSPRATCGVDTISHPAGLTYTRQLGVLIVCSSDQQQITTVGPDVSALNKTLQQEWDVTANARLGNIAISKFSNQKVWWQCHQCPDSHLHQWQAHVHNRSSGAGCPQSSNQKLCKHNSLATVAPAIAQLWDVTKNGCTADEVMAQSHKRFHWQYPDCSHKWMAKPNTKLQYSNGCRKCNKATARKRHATFAECQHTLLAQWDHQQNAVEGLFPHKITLQSNKKVHWLCNKCPLGQQHAWAASPSQRLGKKPSGCPFCAGRAACKCNSVQSLYPSIAAEWDFDSNDETPEDFTASSHREVWWCNAARGSWKQSINTRTFNLHNQAARRQYIKDQPTA